MTHIKNEKEKHEYDVTDSVKISTRPKKYILSEMLEKMNKDNRHPLMLEDNQELGAERI